MQTLAGAERILTIEHCLDGLPQTSVLSQARPENLPIQPSQQSWTETTSTLITNDQAQFETPCFHVTPIREADSPQRKHSDLMLGSIVEPALEEFGLKVIRVDAIEKPGTITRQVFDYLLRARLVVVDLSFRNRDVFCELAIRHAANRQSYKLFARLIAFRLMSIRCGRFLSTLQTFTRLYVNCSHIFLKSRVA